MSGAEPIRFEAVRGWAAAAPLMGAWEQLARTTGRWLPFQEPAWSAAWWHHWPRQQAMRRDEFVLWVGRDRVGRVRALLPAVLSRHPGRGPLGLRLLGPLGRDPNLTELQPLVCRPEDDCAAHAALLRAIVAHSRRWDAFRWASVPAGAAAVLRASAGVERVRSLPDYVLQTGESWPEFVGGLPRNVKEAIRKARNAPRRAGLEFSFKVLREPAEVAAVLPDFLRLHTARSRAGLVPPHPDIFGNPRARAFLGELMRVWTCAGMGRVLGLFHDGRLIACRLAFQMRETHYLYYSGWDPAYAAYSVMTRTVVDGMEWAMAHGVRVFNLSTGTDVAKTRWRPDRIEYETLWQWAPSPRGRLARLLHRLAGHDRRY